MNTFKSLAAICRAIAAQLQPRTECPTCQRVMADTDSCDPRPDAVPYGTEIEDEPGEEPHDYAERCPDCNVTQGSTHHLGCCAEWCAPCDEQRLTCDCDDGTGNPWPSSVPAATAAHR